jgi:hypothetical protein
MWGHCISNRILQGPNQSRNTGVNISSLAVDCWVKQLASLGIFPGVTLYNVKPVYSCWCLQTGVLASRLASSLRIRGSSACRTAISKSQVVDMHAVAVKRLCLAFVTSDHSIEQAGAAGRKGMYGSGCLIKYFCNQ